MCLPKGKILISSCISSEIGNFAWWGIVHIHKRPRIFAAGAQAAIIFKLLADLPAVGGVGVLEHLVDLAFLDG